ncbi:hypothetical protein SAMN05192553_102424 [Cyclobacterium xiamenense]|uniref:Uncharacterized protein n=1 Tax=Cyclobacterium xiamenense TaxID=1297121 RepID=A0A1H6W1X3_9BACT|nr:hypothetical protein SAMN05192553_102424 [Cyclobacterium xiamenense]
MRPFGWKNTIISGIIGTVVFDVIGLLLRYGVVVVAYNVIIHRNLFPIREKNLSFT